MTRNVSCPDFVSLLHVHWGKFFKRRIFMNSQDQRKNPPRQRRVPSGRSSTLERDGDSSAQNHFTTTQPRKQVSVGKRQLLLDPPDEIKRPLCLIRGMAYATSRVNVVDTGNTKTGGGTGQQLAIIRSDGVGFCDVDGYDFLPISRLGVSLKLPELPPTSKLWSTRGMINYMSGDRSNPLRVFENITDVVDHFTDFSHSFASQSVMCDLIACWIFSTWFLDALDVTGYLWLSGERGSGKSNLLNVIARLAHLGMFVSASGTYPAIRDLADCGATICLDDAEALADPRKANSDILTLLLSGNHRGVTVMVKEPLNPRGWKTRYIDGFSPRAFSAIRLPYPVLSSRTILIPLARTNNRVISTLDPEDTGSWPIDPAILIDDLWAVSIEHLPFIRKHYLWVGEQASLHGRALQPWRGILALAAWLDFRGVTHLWKRIDDLSVAYQEEKRLIETSDLTTLVIRAIGLLAITAISAKGASRIGGEFSFTASGVAQAAANIATEEEADILLDYVTSQSVGRVMTNLRVKEIPRPKGRGSRRRLISFSDLRSLLQAYNLDVPPELTDQPNQAAVVEGSSASAPTQPKLCFNCHTSNWIAYPDGSGYFCGTCHPPASKPGDSDAHA